MDDQAKTKEQLIAELAEVRQRLALLEQVINLNPQFIFVKDRDGHFLLANEAFARAYANTSPELLLGRTDAELNPDQALVQQYRQADLAVIDSGRDLVISEEQVIKPNGEVLWRETIKRPMKGPDGTPHQILGIVTDITERKRAQDALQESEERFRRLADANFEGIIIQEEGKILEVNQAVARMFGYELSEMSGMPLITFVPPEWQAWVMGHIEDRYEGMYESMGLKKDGTMFDIEVIGKSLPYKGRLVRVTALRDISERKKTEKALRESEERLRQVFSSISDHIYVTEFTSEKQQINRYMSPTEALTGYPLARLLEDWSFWPTTIIHPEDQALAAAQARSFAQGKNSEIEYRLVRADGEVIWVRDSGRVELDQVTSSIIVYGVVSDITARKYVEEALKKVNRALQQRVDELAILNRITQTVTTVINLQTLLKIVARQITELFDGFSTGISLFNELRTEQMMVVMYQVQEQAGFDPVGQVEPLTHEVTYTNYISRGESLVIPDPQTSIHTQTWHKAIREQKLQCLMLIPLQTRGDIIGTISISTNQVGRQFSPEEVKLAETVAGQIAGAVENARLYAAAQQELAERKRAQEQLAQTLRQVRASEQLLDGIFNTTPDWIYVKDQNFRIRLANKSLIEAMNWGSLEVIGKDELELGIFPEYILGNPEKGLRGVRGDDQAVLAGETRHLPENPALFADGTFHIFDTYKIPLRDAEGKVDAILTFSHDITERIEAEETIAQALEQALEASRLKSQLLAKVSHELRTPLGAILGYTELLQSGEFGPISEQQGKVISKVMDSTHYLTKMVNELLDQAQLEIGKVKLNLSVFTLSDLLAQVETKMSILAQAKGLAFISEIAPDLPPVLLGDLNRLQQILVNLASNAIKFTRQGRVQVRLYRPDLNHWALAVSDTGPGIPKEAQSYIFEPFQQVDGSVTREHVGTGLGLSIVRQLVNLMDGEIVLESEVGQGSTFTVLLPLIAIEESVHD